MSTNTITKIIATSVASLAALSMLAGCSSSSRAEDRILAKLDSMQQEIDDLKNSQSTGSSAGSTDSDAASGSKTDSKDSAAPSDASGFDEQITALEGRAGAAVETAKKATAPANRADAPKAYIDAKAPLEAIDAEADTLEDQLETAVRSGAIDRQTYFQLDHRLDSVDDKLDQGKDALELIMGVDD